MKVRIRLETTYVHEGVVEMSTNRHAALCNMGYDELVDEILKAHLIQTTYADALDETYNATVTVVGGPQT